MTLFQLYLPTFENGVVFLDNLFSSPPRVEKELGSIAEIVVLSS
jgi:hypothetical protein